MDRTILHMDMNNFFASVELLSHPELRDRPVAVAGDKEKRHGIILAKNEIAKRYGVQTATPIWQAQQCCPGLVLLPPHHELYVQYSHAVRRLCEAYTDRIEPFGIDEAWLDVTGSLRIFGSADAIADALRADCKRKLGLTASVGISWNKAFAKLGSDLKKPDAVTSITRENYRALVWELPLGALLYAGKSTQRLFAQYRIYTIGDLARQDVFFVKSIAGKSGVLLWRYANGLDDSPVLSEENRGDVKSIGNSTTTPVDIKNNDEASRILLSLAETVGARARKEGVKGKTVVLHVRESSALLRTTERQRQLSRPTNLTKELWDTSLSLLTSTYQWRVPIRSIGIRLTDLCRLDEPEQLSILCDESRRSKLASLDRTMDAVNERCGRHMLYHAGVISAR